MVIKKDGSILRVTVLGYLNNRLGKTIRRYPVQSTHMVVSLKGAIGVVAFMELDELPQCDDVDHRVFLDTYGSLHNDLFNPPNIVT